MIRKVLLSSVALLAIGGTAFAADLPSRRAPPVYIPPPVPVFSWTGFYLGGQIGYTFGKDRADYSFLGAPYGSFLIGHPNGVIGGLHAGYNFSTQSLLGGGAFLGSGAVIGLEADVDGSDYRSQQALSPFFTQNFKSDIGGSLRGRLGFAVDRALFYATGGVALSEFRSSYTLAIGPFAANDNLTHSRVGWTVGGGVEYAITTNWSLRGEYRYTDFGAYNDYLANSTFGLFSVHNRIIQQRAQVGFSYKFDTPMAAPVVARY